MLHGLCFGEDAGERNLVFLRVKWLQAAMNVSATGSAAVVPDAIGSFYVFCNKWLFLWCSSVGFLKLWLQMATMKGTSCVRRVRLRSFRTRLVPSMCLVVPVV